jgi:hypothetical protein
MGQIYALLIQLVIPILVVELNDIVKSQIIVSYTKKGLIKACRSYQMHRYIPDIVLRSFAYIGERGVWSVSHALVTSGRARIQHLDRELNDQSSIVSSTTWQT